LGLGFGLAAFAQFLGFLLAGAGHGWVAPMFLSIGLWFLLPLALVLAWPSAPTEKPLLFLIAAIAVAADALLIKLSLGETPHIRHYVDVNGAIGFTIIGLWLSLWFCWQVILLYSLAAKRGHD
jgi:hypothetical protein